MASIKAIAPCNFLVISLKKYLEPFKNVKEILDKICVQSTSVNRGFKAWESSVKLFHDIFISLSSHFSHWKAEKTESRFD